MSYVEPFATGIKKIESSDQSPFWGPISGSGWPSNSYRSTDQERAATSDQAHSLTIKSLDRSCKRFNRWHISDYPLHVIWLCHAHIFWGCLFWTEPGLTFAVCFQIVDHTRFTVDEKCPKALFPGHSHGKIIPWVWHKIWEWLGNEAREVIPIASVSVWKWARN